MRYSFPSLLTVTVSLFVFSCKPQVKDNGQQVQMVDPKTIRPHAIVHDTLRADQMEKIKKIHATFSEVQPGTLEETVTDFKRDADPDHEINIWLSMVTAYEKYITSAPSDINIGKKKEAYKLILLRSMMPEKEAKEQAKLKLLTDEEVTEILSFYTDTPEPIRVAGEN